MGTYIMRDGGKGYHLGNKAGSAELISAGSSSERVVSGDANVKFFEFRCESSATSGDNRAIYNRLYITGAGNGGESLRSFTTVEDVAASTAHGAHISLNFGDSGSVTGLGVAGRHTLHIPDDASWAPGNVAALQAEIYSDGADSDTDGATEVAFLRFVNGGNASGVSDVDDDAFLFTIDGGAVGSGNMVQTDNDETKMSHKIRIQVHGTTMYLMAADS